MRKCVAALLVCLTNVFAQPTLYIVRHAEKLANWPERELGNFQPLSEEGIATSNRLAKHFEKFPFAAIYSSSTTRSLHTAFLVVQKSGLAVDTALAMRDTSAIDYFYSTISKKFGPDKSVLLVTHSNIIPYLLIKAGLPKECFDTMGIHQSMESRWLLIEGYDNIYKVEKLGVKRTPTSATQTADRSSGQDGCEGITRGKF